MKAKQLVLIAIICSAVSASGNEARKIVISGTVKSFDGTTVTLQHRNKRFKLPLTLLKGTKPKLHEVVRIETDRGFLERTPAYSRAVRN